MFQTRATPSGSCGASSLLLYDATSSSGYWWERQKTGQLHWKSLKSSVTHFQRDHVPAVTSRDRWRLCVWTSDRLQTVCSGRVWLQPETLWNKHSTTITNQRLTTSANRQTHSPLFILKVPSAVVEKHVHLLGESALHDTRAVVKESHKLLRVKNLLFLFLRQLMRGHYTQKHFPSSVEKLSYISCLTMFASTTFLFLFLRVFLLLILQSRLRHCQIFLLLIYTQQWRSLVTYAHWCTKEMQCVWFTIFVMSLCGRLCLFWVRHQLFGREVHLHDLWHAQF